MIWIRCSNTSYVEIALEGSKPELSTLRDAIFEFCDSNRPATEIAADVAFDPAPYQKRLTQLVLKKTSDLLVISVEGDSLRVSGRPELLRLFAKNLPCDAQDTDIPYYHVHFEPAGMEDCVAESSLGIVLAIKK